MSPAPSRPPLVALTLVDQDPATTSSMGILNVSVGLAHGLAAHAARDRIRLLVLAPEVLRRRLPGASAAVDVRWWPQPPARFARVAWDLFGAARAVRASGADVALFPKGFLPLAGAGATRLLPLVHDRMFAHYASRGWSLGGAKQRFFAFLQDRTIRVAPVVLATSAAVADELRLRRTGPITPIGLGPTGSVPSPATPREALPRADAPLLVLLSPFPHKRSADALRWIEAWADRSGTSRPVLGVGRLPDGVHWPERPGWTREPRLSPEAWGERLGRAAALVYASEYEGYGLPPREALEAGVRAVASDLPVHREHLPPAILFRNDDPDDFARVLDRALASPVPALPFPTPSWAEVAGRALDAAGV